MKMKSGMMNKEFLDYMEDKIRNSNPEEAEFDKALLGLYKKGLVDIKMQNGEPLIQISEKGEESYMQELALSLACMAEA